MKTGLIMEGGAMRGLFTSGVTDVFLENGITFDGAIGVSAGAAFGCNFKSQQAGRAVRYNLRYCRDPRYYGILSLLITGNLFGEQFCYHRIPEMLDKFDFDAFNKNPMPFYVTATDVETGEPMYKKFIKADDCFLEWVRASASLPFVSRMVEIDGRKLQDGGMSDSIPIRFFIKEGYEKNVIILTQPKMYRKKPAELNTLMRTALKKYPKLAECIEKRHIVYNNTLEYIEMLEEQGSALVIRPRESLSVNRTTRSRKKLRQVYLDGRAAGKEALEKVKKFCQ